jgi:hypothetical protein
LQPYCRMYSGLFSSPLFQFPGKKTPPSNDELATFGCLLSPGDLLTDTAVMSGTSYSLNQILVTSVSSCDVLKVGVILRCVIRNDRLLFVLSMYDAIRTKLGFFRAYPCDEVDLTDYKHLSDFKPLVKRDHQTCFHFLPPSPPANFAVAVNVRGHYHD